MKKLLAFVAVAGVSLFALTGCVGGTETLKCTNSTESGGFTIETDQTLIIKNKKVQSLDTLLTTTPNSTMANYLDVYAETLESETNGFGGLKNLTGVDYSAKTKDGKHVVEIKIDYTKVKESEYSELNSSAKAMFTGYDEAVSAKKTQEELENQGYKCTLK